VELAMFAAGVWIYVRPRALARPHRHVCVLGLIGFLLIAYAGNAFGRRPRMSRRSP